MQALGMALLATLLIFGFMFLISKIPTNEPVAIQPSKTLPKKEQTENFVAISVLTIFIVAMLWFVYQYVIPYMD
jgi:hypothetical protein